MPAARRTRSAAHLALAIAVVLAIAVPAGASLKPRARRAKPPPAATALEALKDLTALHDDSGDIARNVGSLERRVDDVRLAITTIQGGIRADEGRLKQRQSRALGGAASAQTTSTDDAGEDPALPEDEDEVVDALRSGERADTLLGAEIRYQEYQVSIMRRRLEDLTTLVRALDFKLGRQQKALELKLTSAREALFRLGQPTRSDAEPADQTSETSTLTATEPVTKADAEATIAGIERAQETVRHRRRELNAIEGDLDLTLSHLDRHDRALEAAGTGSGALLRALRDQAGFLFPYAGPASVTTGGACQRSIHSSVRLSDAQIAKHARDAGFRGFDLSMAVAISLAESGGDPQAVCVNYSGTRDEGLWQINSMHGRPRSCTFDPACAARVAYELYSRRGRSFEDWTVFNSGAVSTIVPRGALAALLLGENPFRIFEMCPVDPPRRYSDDWGVPRPGGRTHQGNDIFADRGTPIRAPFPGIAVASNNGLGGKAVTIYGARGYVYNAHLERHGRSGPVNTGDVVGYVGTSGNAVGTPPHNHFQWHPADGEPINPYPYLNSVCLR